ncbi:hypothetical protein V496_07915, partial [Pseudogymnoascus sp. VKM F-4515 (FW-2607)]
GEVGMGGELGAGSWGAGAGAGAGVGGEGGLLISVVVIVGVIQTASVPSIRDWNNCDGSKEHMQVSLMKLLYKPIQCESISYTRCTVNTTINPHSQPHLSLIHTHPNRSHATKRHHRRDHHHPLHHHHRPRLRYPPPDPRSRQQRLKLKRQ